MIADESFPRIIPLFLSLLAVAIVWLIGVVGYRRFFHPLAKVPGPPLAAITYLYIFYFNAGRTSRFYAQVEKLHEKYGNNYSIFSLIYPSVLAIVN